MWLLQCSISLALKTALWWAPVLFWIHFGNRSRSKFFRVSGASILMWRNHYMIWSACSGRVSYGSNPTFPFQMRVRCIIRISRNVYCRGLHFAVSQSQAVFLNWSMFESIQVMLIVNMAGTASIEYRRQHVYILHIKTNSMTSSKHLKTTTFFTPRVRPPRVVFCGVRL